MREVGTCTIHMISEALSPITHMSGVSGNESILNREKVVYKNNIVDVPVLSGNALRHKMIREPGALYLVEQCDLKGKLNIDQANFMFTGGSLCESSTTDNIPVINKMQKITPLYRLLGGSLKNQVVGGSLMVSRGILCCDENKETLEKMYPQAFGEMEEPLLPAQNFISKYQYTRGDASKRKDASDIICDNDNSNSNLMIYAGETIIQGSIFYHNLTLVNVSPLEIGAALYSLNRWQSQGGVIGGSARIGHGKLKSFFNLDFAVDDFCRDHTPESLVVDYCKHVEENAEEFCAWLKETF